MRAAGRAEHPYTYGLGGMHPFSARQEPGGPECIEGVSGGQGQWLSRSHGVGSPP
jgi:hypothetical protein